MPLHLKPFENKIKRPGPVMNYLAQEAFNDGCDYMYRINDDTELLTAPRLKSLFLANKGMYVGLSAMGVFSLFIAHSRFSFNPWTKVNNWTSIMIAELAKFFPPNVGVVGPRAAGASDNGQILTHDFTSRHHLEIFGIHYPREFPDWYLDNWISHVYGERNSKKLKTVLVIHTGGDETRYKLSRCDGFWGIFLTPFFRVSILKRKAIRLLRKTLKEGREKIRKHLEKFFGIRVRNNSRNQEMRQ